MYRYSAKLLALVRNHVKNGGVIAYPTESCYGLGCDPFNRHAISKIIKLKGRNSNKGLIVVAAKEAQLRKLIRPLSPNDLNEISINYWPGPYSLALPVQRSAPNNLIGKHDKIVVRITIHPLVAQLCNYLNLPLVSTSANFSKCRSIKTYRECLRQFGNQVMVLPGSIGFAKKPSTIIDWATKEILR